MAAVGAVAVDQVIRQSSVLLMCSSDQLVGSAESMDVALRVAGGKSSSGFEGFPIFVGHFSSKVVWW